MYTQVYQGVFKCLLPQKVVIKIKAYFAVAQTGSALWFPEQMKDAAPQFPLTASHTFHPWLTS